MSSLSFGSRLSRRKASPSAGERDLIDTLPYLGLNLAQAPEDLLRTLFEVTQLAIRIDADGDRATLEITLPEDQLPGDRRRSGKDHRGDVFTSSARGACL
ncbi:hypothetical protein [Amycolatopsis kentuckyensis]|uniref:hypothetical protein n=1 Tax=Amycolatopsis kentuckyensis TaxID=218823 RepID=UPI000A3A1A27|nr:hypothetical protein [Amycolatopsis kentuckyensis]